MKALEIACKEKVIGSSLDAKVRLYCDGELYDFVSSLKEELIPVFIVSQLEIEKGGKGDYVGEAVPELSVTVSHAEGEKCARCWCYSNTVGTCADHPDLCSRCAAVME